MARDHFQDIIPPEHYAPPQEDSHKSAEDEGYEESSLTIASKDKSIRNISITRKAAPAEQGRVISDVKRSKNWLWGLAVACALILASLLALYVFRRTVVSVVAHVQPVVFDSSMQFTAYPTNTTATGTLHYQVYTTDLTASQTAATTGITHQDIKASGTITVYNAYSSQSVPLLKATRFQTAAGLVFHAPDAILVPGKKGTTPGQVTITVIADAAGAQYNVGANQKFTLPGLQGNAAMFAGIYAQSNASTTRGFSGNAPTVSNADLAAASSKIEAQLQKKAMEFASSSAANSFAFKPQISFTTDSPSPTSSDLVNITEHARVLVAVIPLDQISAAVAQAVTADSPAKQYQLLPVKDLVSTIDSASAVFGTDPITFSLTGSAKLVAIIDTKSLATALAGRNSSAFEAIVRNFPGVESAHARIEPFWETSFPTNPNDVLIEVLPVQN